MTGGELYVCDLAGRLPLRLNGQLVVAERGAPESVRALIEHHLRHTGSARAADLLERWGEFASSFWRVAPRTEPAASSEAMEAAGAAV
jgi:glutamate synthase domain-containing protein 3